MLHKAALHCLLGLLFLSFTIQPTHQVHCHSRHLKTSLGASDLLLSGLLAAFTACLVSCWEGPWPPPQGLWLLLGRSPCVALTSSSSLVSPSCWCLSSSSFLRKGTWEVTLLRACMSKGGLHSALMFRWVCGWAWNAGLEVLSQKSGGIAVLCCNLWDCVRVPHSPDSWDQVPTLRKLLGSLSFAFWNFSSM